MFQRILKKLVKESNEDRADAKEDARKRFDQSIRESKRVHGRTMHLNETISEHVRTNGNGQHPDGLQQTG